MAHYADATWPEVVKLSLTSISRNLDLGNEKEGKGEGKKEKVLIIPVSGKREMFPCCLSRKLFIRKWRLEQGKLELRQCASGRVTLEFARKIPCRFVYFFPDSLSSPASFDPREYFSYFSSEFFPYFSISLFLACVYFQFLNI